MSDARAVLPALNVAAKVAVAVLIAVSFALPDLRETGPERLLRVFAYPAAAALLPAVWWARGRPRPYPHLADLLIVLAAVIELSAALSGLYGVGPLDHVLHFVNTALVAAGFGSLLAPLRVGRVAAAALTLGFGSVAHTTWEILQLGIVEALGADFDITQRTTILNFMTGLLGAAAAAVVTATVLVRRSELAGELIPRAATRPLDAVRIRPNPTWALWANVAVKLALAGLTIFYLVQPDLPQFEGKAMWFRSAFFPVAALAVPAIARLRGTRPYPHLADALIVLPLVVDAGGNAADLYRFEWFDHTVHFANMVMIATALGLLLTRLPMARLVAAAIVLGVGDAIHTVWEILEWSGVELLDLELDVEYITTMRDFMAGLAGSVVGAVLTATVVDRRRREAARDGAGRG